MSRVADPERHAPRFAVAAAGCLVAAPLVGGWPGLLLASISLPLALRACWSADRGLLVVGPVVGYELVRIARRQRLVFARTVIAIVVAVVVGVVYAAFVPLDRTPWFTLTASPRVPMRAIAEFGTALFAALVTALFIMVFFVAPGLSADAVAEEKERQTLDFLLTTDLRNREIVLGKFAGRAAYLGLFLITLLPFFAMLSWFGGVPTEMALACYAAAAVTLPSVLAVAAFWSVHARTVRQAGSWSYVTILAYATASGLLWLLVLDPDVRTFPSTPTWQSPVEVEDVVRAANVGNPISALVATIHELDAGAKLDDVLPTTLGRYAAFHFFAAAPFGLPALARLRTVAAIHAGGKVGKAGRAAKAPRLPPVLDAPVLWRNCTSSPSGRGPAA